MHLIFWFLSLMMPKCKRLTITAHAQEQEQEQRDIDDFFAGSSRRRVLDPRCRWVQRWNRVVLLARAASLAVDPLFFYVIFLTKAGPPCFYRDAAFAAVVTAARTCVDLVHVCHVWLHFRLAYVSTASLVVGSGSLVWDARAVASHYVRSFKGFWLDLFVIIPIPQVVTWLVVRKLLREEEIKEVMRVVLVSYLFQFFPKLYHSIYLMNKLQKVTGYIFGSIWWRFSLNVFAYLIASHVAGGCWYLLATQRLISCLEQQCERRKMCKLALSCSGLNSPISGYKGVGKFVSSRGNNSTTIKSLCLEVNGPFSYGIYEPVLLVFSSNSLAVRILYPVFWGLLNLSSFGNELDPTSDLVEVIFSCCITLAGLVLFVTLIGNIQIFLQTVMASKETMQIRFREMNWWMKRRQLPVHLRERVCNFEYQRWVAMGGLDETELIGGLPDGLRRDIKRYLCLDLVRKVPFFHMLDDLILDNICDRVKPLLYAKGEKIVREGDPVQRVVFIVEGCVERSQGRLSKGFVATSLVNSGGFFGEGGLSKGSVATSLVNSGGFFGEELLSWCLRHHPHYDKLPTSLATFSCVQPVEAYGLDAGDLKYITEHFRYKFASERLNRTMRYYSSNWRTWGAVVIQLSWRWHQMRTRGYATQKRKGVDSRLRQYAAVFLSLKPNDHLE
ncbi:cyclic nucleotide-gated ion channel 2-like [Momordica charantia]|uniref:Cyclic nucleotide-gated ion channel 2-like n=1 Tax=Momordica charantia TaxID=3673 RepID=A0A6J1CGT1_MOMCH|nr:cyclic nucleotide-gated ion channel 2-like [Momordica charantia]